MNFYKILAEKYLVEIFDNSNLPDPKKVGIDSINVIDTSQRKKTSNWKDLQIVMQMVELHKDIKNLKSVGEPFEEKELKWKALYRDLASRLDYETIKGLINREKARAQDKA